METSNKRETIPQEVNKVEDKQVSIKKESNKGEEQQPEPSNLCDSSSPPPSPVVVKRRRSRIHMSDDEYVLSAEESDSTDQSSLHSEETSCSSRRKSNRKRTASQSLGKRQRSNSKTNDDKDFKVKRVEKVPILAKRKTLAKNQKRTSPVDNSSLPVPLGPLLTPPPQQHYSPTAASPISLISTPQTVIQTNSHTILVPPNIVETESDVKFVKTHIATVTSDQTPPETPLVTGGDTAAGQQGKEG